MKSHRQPAKRQYRKELIAKDLDQLLRHVHGIQQPRKAEQQVNFFIGLGKLMAELLKGSAGCDIRSRWCGGSSMEAALREWMDIGRLPISASRLCDGGLLSSPFACVDALPVRNADQILHFSQQFPGAEWLGEKAANVGGL